MVGHDPTLLFCGCHLRERVRLRGVDKVSVLIFYPLILPFSLRRVSQKL
jgi:hypothetical protein